MENTHRLRARYLCCFLPALLTVLIWAPARAHAAALTESDFTLALYASDVSSGSALDASEIKVFFNPHRCNCPDTITAVLQLTSSGQTDIGSSTISVNFLLGPSCATSTTSASCVSVGQRSFSASQSATAPTFDSNLVFQTAAGSSTVACTSLTSGSTVLWAVLAQDGTALSFTPSVVLPVITTVVAAPTAVTAQPADQGILVSWTPPADMSQVAGYQVLCLPRPASASTAAYESCGLDSSSVGSTVLTPADQTQVCSAEISAATTSVRLAGLVNGTSYTLAVISIDPGGGVSALSAQAQATPQATTGFYEKYKQSGGAASGCTLSPHPGRAGLLWMALVAALVVALGRGRRRRGRARSARGGQGGLSVPKGRRAPHATTTANLTRAVVLLFALSATARAQVSPDRRAADWPWESPAPPVFQPPDWGFELGLSLYRPAVDSEFGNGVHPFADTFGSSRHLLSEVEVDRYLSHRYGTWGVGLRSGYYKVTGAAFLADGITRSGDETALRLIPFSLSSLFRADRIPGLKRVPLMPYLKAGLDGVVWTASRTGGSGSHTGFTPGWHLAAGVAIGLNFLGLGSLNPGALADPCALFFEWDYAAINGLGLDSSLHVGDSTWFAGVMFDL
jgi:hypothetical protein